MIATDLKDVDIEALEAMGPEQLLRFAFESFPGRAAIGTSLQKTGIVTIDLASRLGVPYRVFFIDTLLNHEETYELLGKVEQRYGIDIERYRPTPESLAGLHEKFGDYAHYFGRELCCRVRKKLPLREALATLDVWISGLRADQSDFRRDNARKAQLVADDEGRPILKLNCMLEWTDEMVDDYSRRETLPYNKLYDYVSPHGERYTVVGCRCCHVPVKESMDKRMGKFPWEHGKKECGLHDQGGGI